MQLRTIVLICSASIYSASACVSSLPDEPTVLPQGPVKGLLPAYLTEAEAHLITLEADADFPDFIRADQTLSLDTLRLWVDTLVGVRIGVLDTFGQFEPRALLRVPGITALDVDVLGRLTVSNHGDRVTGRLVGTESWEEERREVGAVPPSPTYPLRRDVWAAGGADQPGPLIEERYFACFDASRGLVGGWAVGTITGAPCLTSVFE